MANAPRRARLMRFLATLSVAGLLTAWPAPVGAAPLTRDKVPEPLRPWIDWVLRGHEETACPFFAGMKGGGAEGGDQEGGDQQGEATDPESR